MSIHLKAAKAIEASLRPKPLSLVYRLYLKDKRTRFICPRDYFAKYAKIEEGDVIGVIN